MAWHGSKQNVVDFLHRVFFQPDMDFYDAGEEALLVRLHAATSADEEVKEARALVKNVAVLYRWDATPLDRDKDGRFIIRLEPVVEQRPVRL